MIHYQQNIFDRFIIELTPRLRELGITTNVILNNSFEETNIIGIVDFLINEKGDLSDLRSLLFAYYIMRYPNTAATTATIIPATTSLIK